MKKIQVGKFALAGLISASLLEASNLIPVTNLAPLAQLSVANNNTLSLEDSSSIRVVFKDTHSCKFKNSCKGLGGCNITKEEQQAAASIYGLDKKEIEKLKGNGCAGENSCKGLGGCAVNAASFKKLKEKLNKKN